MPEQVTFDVQHNGTNTSLPPWTIRVYPIDTEGAANPGPWLASITPGGLTIHSNVIATHMTWHCLISATLKAALLQGALP